MLRWPGVLGLVAAIGWRVGGWRSALGGGVAMAGVGIVGYWEPMMITLSIMVTAVVIALAIGIPLGIWCGRSDRAQRWLRPLLDTAQVMPAFAYFGPLVLAFSIGIPPAVMATVIYAVPPAVRLTAHGIRGVPTVLNEAALAFGADARQHTFKVQLPVARRSILLGVNQVIMMAFGIVVLGSLLGTGDTGLDVLKALQKNDVGAGFAPGMAITLAAIALDRITTGARQGSYRQRWTDNRAIPWLFAAGGLLVAYAGRARRWPAWAVYHSAHNVNRFVKWVSDRPWGIPVVTITRWITDVLTADILIPFHEFLTWMPWPVVVGAIAVVGMLSGGWRLALIVAGCMVAIAAMGTVPGGTGGRTTIWDHALNTLSQVLVAIVISVLVAVPIGIAAGRSKAFYASIRPVLDVLQVMPQFVYLIPVLVLFQPGRTAGVVASVVYAIPPCIRLTALGMQEVPDAPREAARSFGATARQERNKVQVPLAMRSILLGVNQTILMVLATVVIAGLIGSGALGLLALGGFQKQQSQIGQGMAAGLSIVLLAIVLDRITQAWGSGRRDQSQPRGN